MIQLIGWISSALLLLTVGIQIFKQWRERTARGVSVWLYIGQAFASLGFALYSVLVGNWVFIFTNAALTVAALLGLVITVLYAAKPAREPARS